MRYQTYEAAVARAETIQRARAQQPVVERLGGRLEIQPTRANGMTLIVLTLPEPYQPETFLPGIPFYPV